MEQVWAAIDIDLLRLFVRIRQLCVDMTRTIPKVIGDAQLKFGG